jgi:hypothetical protein
MVGSNRWTEGAWIVSSISIALGTETITSDGLAFGKVDRFVVAPESRSLAAIIVRYGRIPTERDFIVAWKLIDHAEGQEVYLKFESADVEKLPEIVKSVNVTTPTQSSASSYMYSWGGANAMSQSAIMGDSVRAGTSVVSGGVPVEPGSMTAFDLGSAGIVSQSNLPENTSMVSDNTDVMTSDEKKIGVVHEAVCNEEGVITGFYLRAGRIRHHDRYVPVTLVEGGNSHRIRLRVTSAEAATALSDRVNE